MDSVKKCFIENLKRYRTLHGYSQMKLAELAELSTSFIAEIETGKKFPSTESIEKISTALKVKPHQMFMENNEESVEWNRLSTLNLLSKELKMEIDSLLEKTIDKYLNFH